MNSFLRKYNIEVSTGAMALRGGNLPGVSIVSLVEGDTRGYVYRAMNKERSAMILLQIRVDSWLT